jgi:hypothetical protein
MKQQRLFEYSVFVDRGQVFLTGPTDRICQLTFWEVIKLGWTGEYSKRALEAVRPRENDDLKEMLRRATRRGKLSSYTNNLSKQISEYPFPTAVQLHLFGPKHPDYDHMWLRACAGEGNFFHVRAHVREIMTGFCSGMISADTFEPVDFVFVLTDSKYPVGRVYEHIKPHMEDLLREFMRQINDVRGGGDARRLDFVKLEHIEHAKPEKRPTTVMLNMYADRLSCPVNPPPFRGDVTMYGYMPGAEHYQDVLAAAKNGAPDHYIAQAHWHSVNTDADIAPTPFVFVARSHDPAFQHKTGLDGAYLHGSMKELAIQFAGMCNRCSTAQVRLKDLTIEEPSE